MEVNPVLPHMGRANCKPVPADVAILARVRLLTEAEGAAFALQFGFVNLRTVAVCSSTLT